MARRQDRRSRGRQDEGYSLVELMIASTVSLLVVGGLFTVLESMQTIHRDSNERVAAQQSARLALDQVARDVQLAGVGLVWLLPPFALIEPLDDGFRIYHNQEGVTTFLVQDMGSEHSVIKVDDVTGFAEDDQVVIYDAAGSLDLFTIDSIDGSNQQFHHSGLSKAYTTADGAAIARVETVTYELIEDGPAGVLVRQRDTDDAAQPVARNVRDVTITYYDDSQPPQAFEPTTTADMLRIRVVEIEIEVVTEHERLSDGTTPAVILSQRIAPRALALAS